MGRIRTQVGMRFEVPEHRGDLRSSREESREDVGRDLREGEVVTLSIKHVDDLIEAHEVADEWQILTIACLIRVGECAGYNVAQFVDVAHVNHPQCRIKRKSPAHGPVCLLLRTKGARKILVVERGDDEGVIFKPAILHYPIDLRLAGKVGNIELATADRFYIRQR